jgi:hypothetical protein
LNLPDIQVLNVEITEREIKCDIEHKVAKNRYHLIIRLISFKR